jgi:hypothetical protein
MTDLPPGLAASLATILADIVMEDYHKEHGQGPTNMKGGKEG